MKQSPTPERVSLETPLARLPGIGPRLEEKLGRLDLLMLGDMLWHAPLRYEDRHTTRPLAGLAPGESGRIDVQVVHAAVIPGRRRTLQVAVEDGSGIGQLTFFRFYPNWKKQYPRGRKLSVFGEMRVGRNGREMIHPQSVDADADVHHYLAVYPTGAGLRQSLLRRLVELALQVSEAPEYLTAKRLAKLRLLPLTRAWETLHRPQLSAPLESQIQEARRRIALEELVLHRLALLLRRHRLQSQKAPRLDGRGAAQAFLDALAFAPTGAQTRVIDEILGDIAQPQPMLRLLQGDVGSGKTVVAGASMAAALESGFQAALAAPTEILAEQHARSLTKMLGALDIEVVLLTGKMSARSKREALERLRRERVAAVGTHALMQQAVEFDRLGLVVIDEQHRFGVHQRLALKDKASVTPHQLVMTATPIPRTLAMVGYADLDLSVLDELPPGRQPIETVVLPATRREEIIRRIRSVLEDGGQAYWICTLVESSEKLAAEAATSTFALLSSELSPLGVGLIHGRLKSEEKDDAMRAFLAAETALLVATTVVEVGVDNPNATLIIIDNAERLGLAQLHQLRGRVGRGSRQSHCVLVYDPPLSKNARERLKILRQSNDGFVIAERDLALRGSGELLGTRQAGLVDLKIARLEGDEDLQQAGADIARELIATSPEIARLRVERWLAERSRYAEV